MVHAIYLSWIKYLAIYKYESTNRKISQIILCILLLNVVSYVYQIRYTYTEQTKIPEYKDVPKHITIDSVTVYNATKAQCDSEPLITASNDTIDLKNFPENWIALSRDVMQKHGINYGDTVILVADDASMCGCFIVKDTMNKRKKNCADLLCKDRKLGLSTNVKLYKYND